MWCDGIQDVWEVLVCQGGDDHDGQEDGKSPSRANKEKKEEEVAIVVLGSCMAAAESLPSTIKIENARGVPQTLKVAQKRPYISDYKDLFV